MLLCLSVCHMTVPGTMFLQLCSVKACSGLLAVSRKLNRACYSDLSTAKIRVALLRTSEAEGHAQVHIWKVLT